MASPRTRVEEDDAIRRVSVIAPMRNEATHIADFVRDLAAQDFDGELEVLVADGCSTDGSAARLEAAAAEHGLRVLILDNPERWVSYALNRCIRRASGDLIIRVDCHSRYPADYVRRCVEAAEQTQAANVGGILVPIGSTPVERAVACAMDSPFGGIHWTRHRTNRRVEVDTVPYGAFRPATFRRVGLFDESLVRNQDDEFNLRLRRAGGRIVLDPAIRVYYTPRSSLRQVFRQYFEYGFWKPAVMRKHLRVVSARSLAPAVFVLSTTVLAATAFVITAAELLLAGELAVYSGGALVFGAIGLRRADEGFRLLPRVVAVFPTMHWAYGVGMLVGILRALVPKPR